MRFTLLKDIKQDLLMRPLMFGFLLFTLLYLIADIFVKQSTVGLLPHAIASTFFGDEELYLDPMAQSLFLEWWHGEIFMVMMLVFTLSTLYIRLSEASFLSIILVNLLFLSSFASLATLAAAYFLMPSLLSVYASSFFLWHTIAVFMVFASCVRLLRA